MTVTTRFLVDLKSAAEAAKVAEGRFRREAAVRIAALEQERAFAFRRLNLMQAIFEAMASAESEEIAVASAFATLRMRLGWNSDSEARSEVIARFGLVVLAIFRASEEGESANDIPETLAGFEHWYAETRGSPFWLLFERQIQDTPRVDF